MSDGIINLDTDRGKEIGFIFEKFEPGSYLWKIGERIYISLIVSRIKGSFQALVKEILRRGWQVAVPTPLGRMQEIVQKNGYKKTLENFKIDEKHTEICEVWVLRPPQEIT